MILKSCHVAFILGVLVFVSSCVHNKTTITFHDPGKGIYTITKCYVPDVPTGHMVPYRIVYLSMNKREYKTEIDINHSRVRILKTDQDSFVEFDANGNATALSIAKGFCKEADFRNLNWQQ